jgi:hypothetical protein
MLILGVPENIDPSTLRPTSEWRLSAATEKALALRADTVARAREEAATLTDAELRAQAAAWLKTEAQTLGELPREFPDAATMTRDQLLDFVAEGAAFDPEIEVVYPGADA